MWLRFCISWTFSTGWGGAFAPRGYLTVFGNKLGCAGWVIKCSWHLMRRGQGFAKHPTMHRTACHNRTTFPQMSLVPRLRHPIIEHESLEARTRKLGLKSEGKTSHRVLTMTSGQWCRYPCSSPRSERSPEKNSAQVTGAESGQAETCTHSEGQPVSHPTTRGHRPLSWC